MVLLVLEPSIIEASLLVFVVLSEDDNCFISHDGTCTKGVSLSPHPQLHLNTLLNALRAPMYEVSV
jgi:hypothetical protein